MPRVGRKSVGGVVYHVLNRTNGRARLFHKPADYAAFLRMIGKAKEAVPMRVLGYCLMPNHWHLVLWPRADGDLSRFMLRLATAHVRRMHLQRQGRAGVRMYQGRFKSFPVQKDSHLLTVLRYVEANPFRKNPAVRAWRWSSLAERSASREDGLLDALPLPLPGDWQKIVRRRWSKEELAELRESVNRGRPFGSAKWVAATAKKLNLEFTLRPRGRPRKVITAAAGARSRRK
jgi:putative transposase